MIKIMIPLGVLTAVALAGCAGQSRDARCEARGYGAGSTELQSCVKSLAAEDRFKRNRLRKYGQGSGS